MFNKFKSDFFINYIIYYNLINKITILKFIFDFIYL